MKQTILGIDPGYAIVGWGIIESDAYTNHYIHADCIKTPSSMPFSERLETIFLQIKEIIATYKPESVAIEKLFFNTNTKTAIDVSQARGVILLAIRLAQLPVFEYTPLQVKQSLIGYGRGDKKQIISMLKHHFPEKDLPTQDDTCDALAIALTYKYMNGMNNRIR